MNVFQIAIVILLVSLGATNRSLAAPPVRLPGTETASQNVRELQLAANEVLLQPAHVVGEFSACDGGEEYLPLGDQSALSLDELEQMALANNPAIAQAAAQVTALRGRWMQAGLPPNPTAGYVAEEMGDAGTAGKQGGFIGQDFITGGKLRLNRAIVAQDILRAEQLLASVTLSTRTDVRKAFYKALVAREKVRFATTWAQDASQAREALGRLRSGGINSQMSRVETFPLDLLYQNAPVELARAESEQRLALQQLSILTDTDVSDESLEEFNIRELPDLLEWDAEVRRVTSASPEAAAASFQIARAQTSLQRARVERIPDLSTEVMVQFDNATEDTVTGVRVGLPLPIWNRNQGGIRQAQAEISEAQRNLDRVEHDLVRRLAIAFETYSVARRTVETYTQPPTKSATQPGDAAPTETMTPLEAAEEARSHAQRLFPDEIGALDAATVYRGYTETNLLYLDALDAHWASWAEIEGLLLSDSLAQPPR